jgi:hypothetical protein
VTETLCQFGFSEDKAKKNNRDIFFVFLPLLIVCMAGSALYITGFQVKKVLPIIRDASLISLVIFAVETPLLRRSQRKIKAFIYDDRIVKKCGKQENSMSWNNITRVKIIEYRGETVHIRLRGKDKATLWLFGLNEMEKLADLIRQRMPSDILVHTRKHKLSFRLTGVTSVVVATVAMMSIASLGMKVMEVFFISFVLGVSLFLFSYRPFSKTDASLKWPEIVLCLLLFMLGIYGLVNFICELLS